jgi:hypothetical protein
MTDFYGVIHVGLDYACVISGHWGVLRDVVGWLSATHPIAAVASN